MPSIFLSSMHPRVFDAMCIMFNSIGWEVYVPSNTEPNPFGYGTTHVAPKSKHTAITHNQFLDIKPDVVLCSCWEQIRGAQVLAREVGARLVCRAGNNNVPYNSSHSEYLISNDLHTYKKCNIPNKLFFYLPPDYDFWSKQDWQKDSYIVSSFIHHYQRFWKTSWKIFNEIRQRNPEIAIVNYGVNPGDGFYNPVLKREEDVRRALSISRLMLHVKELEGYGWSMLEAISCGIPVVAVRRFVKGKTCEHFLKDNVSCIFIEGKTTEFVTIFNNTEQLYKISEEGPKFVRNFINKEEQYSKVRKFFEEVVLG